MWTDILIPARSYDQVPVRPRVLNPLTPNDPYRGRTAPLTSKRCILYIYSTNIGTKYFKHGIYSPFFFLFKMQCFIILTYLVPILFTFYIQGMLKLKKIKHGIYSSVFSSSKYSLLHNSNVFDSCIIHILYIGCAKTKKKSGAKRLNTVYTLRFFLFKIQFVS